MAKACAPQGSRKTGARSSPRGIGATSAAARIASSGRLKVAFPGVDGDDEVGIRLLAPKLPAAEPHRVEPLRRLALAVGVRIRKHVDAVEPFDHPLLIAG